MERLIIRPKRTTWGGAESAETAMLMGRLPDGAEVREKGLRGYGEGADNNPKGLKVGGADAPDGAEEVAGHEGIL